MVVRDSKKACCTGNPEEAGKPIAIAGAETGGAGIAMTRRSQKTHWFTDTKSESLLYISMQLSLGVTSFNSHKNLRTPRRKHNFYLYSFHVLGGNEQV